ncbi:MAG: murein biosynthesis integral membrane protein MurJ [Treponema sp.]|nr:murein biosynthesis integral membrane protein MurJ [Treponema sp.]
MEENGELKIKKKGSSLIAKGLSLSVLTLFSRILGLVREMTKANFLGTSNLSDAFGIAFMVPNLFRRLFAENSISVAFIPTFKGYLEESGTEEGKKNAQNFISATFTLITFCVVLFVTLGIIFTPQILKIFFPESQAAGVEAANEAVILTRIMFPYLAVISVAAFFQGILNALKIFSPSGFTPILFNSIVVALTYILAPHTENPARAMSIGVITGGTVQCLFQLPFVLKNKWRITFTSLKKAFTNPGTRKVLALIGPTIIGMAGYQINDIASSALATRAGEGIVSSLQYSLRLQELILGICAVTIGTVILPDLTGYAKREEWSPFNTLLTQSIKIMALISIPITFYSLVMGKDIIALVFASGRFDENSTLLTQGVFNFHIAGLFFIAVNRIISQSFYAQSDTKSPTIAGLINFGVNISLALVLVGSLAGRGIALALTAASFVNTVVLLIFLRRTPTIDVKNVVKSSLFYSVRLAVMSVAAAVPVYFLREPLEKIFSGHSRIISYGIPVAATAFVFGITGLFLLFITKDPILKAVINKIRKR